MIFTCGDVLEIKHAIARGDAVVDESIYAKSTRMVKKLIGGADVYLIRENMCTLIDVASPKIESFRIEAHDVPSVNGFCLLDRWGPSAMQEATYHGRPIDFVQAIHWWVDFDSGDGVFTTFSRWESRAHQELPVAASLVVMFGYEIINETKSLLDTDVTSNEAMLADASIRRWIACLLCLLRQKLPMVTRERATREYRRRLLRQGETETEINVIDLRLPEHERGARMEHSPVEWSHRWMVSGHWCQQWYPKDEVNRPKWIMPYVKGPEDKPLEIKPTVHVLRR